MQSWYAINSISEDETEVRIYDSIGAFGISASRFADQLDQITSKKISLRINSPGGEIFNAFAIASSIKAHPAEVTVHIDGLAASAASIVAIAGDEIRMADNAFMMIHDSMSIAIGGAEDMRKQAEAMDKFNDSIASTYQARAGKTRKYWRDKMADETWFTAKEAKTEGLIDAVDGSVKGVAKNAFDFAIYNHAPEAAKKLWEKQALQAGQILQLSPDENITQISAPEPSASAGETPVSQTQEPAMATATTDAPAQNPAAPNSGNVTQEIDSTEAHKREMDRLKGLTTEAQFDAGRLKGISQGQNKETDRMKAIAEVCPGRPQMAIDAFLSGQTPEAVKLAFDAAAKAEAAAKLREQEKDREIARWQNIAATGGYPGGVPTSIRDDNDSAQPDADPKLQAEQEWDHKPSVRRGFSSKQNYVNFRISELKGQLRVQTGPATEK